MSAAVLDADTAIIVDIDDEVEFEEPTVSHLITKEDYMNGYVNGVVIMALCGHKFIPTRDPDKLPLCQKCAEIARNIFGDNNGL